MSYFQLTEKSQTIKQPKGLDIKLRPHQLTSVAAMMELENKSHIIIDNPNIGSKLYNSIRHELNDVYEFTESTYLIETNTAILADKVGSGKTYIIIGLLLAQKKPLEHNRFLLGTNNFSIKMISSKKSNNVNLIVVPHNLSNQWNNFIEHSTLKYIKLNKTSDFNIFFDIDYVNNKYSVKNTSYTIFNNTKKNNYSTNNSGSKTNKKFPIYERKTLNKSKVDAILNNTDAIVLNVNRYKLFKSIFPSELWSRVIIDEMDSANIPPIFNEIGNFNWFITATPTGIFTRSCRKYISKTFGRHYNLIEYFTVKNVDNYVDKSITLPDPNIFFVKTLLQKVISAIKDLLPSDVLNLINAGNLKEAITKLNCNISTSNNIVYILTENIKTELENSIKELKYVKSLITNDRDAHKIKIQTIETNIEKNKSKLKTIEDRVSSIKDEVCVICAGSYNKPTIVHCCKNIYCFECLIGSLASCYNKCPMCRANVAKDLYTVIDEESKVNKSEKKINKTVQFSNLDKSDVLEHILTHIKKSYKSPKILIFSDYHQTFDKIKTNINNAKLKYAKILGVPTHITNVINQFNTGLINVLLLDSSHYGSGLNLQSANFVILYHRMSNELETQVIGRAHRFGRKTPLNVIYLVNNSESCISNLSDSSNNIETPDDFNLFTNIDETTDKSPNRLDIFDIKQDDALESDDIDNYLSDEELIDVRSPVDELNDMIMDKFKYSSSGETDFEDSTREDTNYSNIESIDSETYNNVQKSKLTKRTKSNISTKKKKSNVTKNKKTKIIKSKK